MIHADSPLWPERSLNPEDYEPKQRYREDEDTAYDRWVQQQVDEERNA